MDQNVNMLTSVMAGVFLIFIFIFFFTFIKKAVMFNVFCSATCVSVFYMTPTQGDLVNFYFQRGDQ